MWSRKWLWETNSTLDWTNDSTDPCNHVFYLKTFQTNELLVMYDLISDLWAHGHLISVSSAVIGPRGLGDISGAALVCKQNYNQHTALINMNKN